MEWVSITSRSRGSLSRISISHAQRRPVSGAGGIRTIHHGLPERLLTPQAVRPAYFAFSAAFRRKRLSIGDLDSQEMWRAAEDRRQGRCGRPRLFRIRNPQASGAP
jgi:hypothetical protein